MTMSNPKKTGEPVRLDLTAEQAEILRRYFAQKAKAEQELTQALALVGVKGTLTGGNLDGEKPQLTYE
jgi:hypothetical protein